jgi:hypothetical protein
MSKRSVSPPAAEGPLRGVVPFDEYLFGREHVFRSEESLRWFYRRHRAALLERGAVIEVGGRLLAVADKFDQAVLELARDGRRSRPWATRHAG